MEKLLLNTKKTFSKSNFIRQHIWLTDKGKFVGRFSRKGDVAKIASLIGIKHEHLSWMDNYTDK